MSGTKEKRNHIAVERDVITSSINISYDEWKGEKGEKKWVEQKRKEIT